MDNIQMIRQLYKDFASGNMAAVLSNFDKDVVWIRPGAPAIPFAGTFKGIEGLMQMFSIISQTVKINGLHAKKFSGNDDTVIVIGEDKADVIATGKSYLSEWVYVYTVKNNKIIHVQVYLDTLVLSEAFIS